MESRISKTADSSQQDGFQRKFIPVHKIRNGTNWNYSIRYYSNGHHNLFATLNLEGLISVCGNSTIYKYLSLSTPFSFKDQVIKNNPIIEK